MPKHVVCWLQEGSFCNTRFIESDCLIGEGLSAVGCTDLERGICTSATKREEHNVVFKDEPFLVVEEGTVENRDHYPICTENCKQVKKLVICDRNYCGGCVFDIRNNDQLQTLVVKNRCFYEGFFNSDAKGLLRIMSCCSLKTISIGDSFCNYFFLLINGKRSSHL